MKILIMILKRFFAENLENARTHVAKEVKAADHNQHIVAKLLEQSESDSSRSSFVIGTCAWIIRFHGVLL